MSFAAGGDGFITGPNPRPDAPLGNGGERLHHWMSGITDLRESRRAPNGAADADAQVLDDAYRVVEPPSGITHLSFRVVG